MLDEWMKEQLAKGYIRPSKSPQASPFFFVEKKPNAYPLPLIVEIIL
jgi:hypothetical protein